MYYETTKIRTWWNGSKGMVVLALIGWLAATMPVAAQFTLLHSFSGEDGYFPVGSLTLSGSTLYGMTHEGGSSEKGTVFKINTDGTGFTLLHSFSGKDGAFPNSSLTLSGSTLYGMTRGKQIRDTLLGKFENYGTVFKINTDGTGFTLLHSFSVKDGAFPDEGSLTLSGSTLYGMTLDGGSSYMGTVFKINTDGTGFTLLHSFSGSDGIGPFGSLTLSSSTLYGMTFGTNIVVALFGTTIFGRVENNGAVFKINTDGTGFRVLHSFSGKDGIGPRGSLTLSGSTLYGVTTQGGSSYMGTVFKINTDGTGFRVLHTFSGEDGAFPSGPLTLSGSTLYGITRIGGNSDMGTVFKINTDGTGFRVLHTFSGEDGAYPVGYLTMSGSTLYGITREGGSSGNGTVFSIAVP
jgi:uncharacterized repeat protein (TIGR03803 family)